MLILRNGFDEGTDEGSIAPHGDDDDDDDKYSTRMPVSVIFFFFVVKGEPRRKVRQGI